MVKLLSILSLVLCSSAMLVAQVSPASPGFGVASSLDTIDAASDTVVYQKSKGGILSVFKGKPGRAALFALVLPGSGQAYNRSYWKIPIALAIDGAAFYNLFRNRSKFKEWDDALTQLRNGEITEYRGFTQTSQFLTLRNDFRKNMEYGYLIAIGAHLLTVMDAFVDRHLREFDISDDLTVQYRANELGVGIAVCYSLN